MKAIFALILVLASQPAIAGKLVNQDVRQYFPSFGLGSTQSTAYTATASSTSQILSPNGGMTELVEIVTSSDAFVAEAAIASSTSLFVPAKTPLIIEVLSGDTISAKQVNSGGTLFVTHLPTFPLSK